MIICHTITYLFDSAVVGAVSGLIVAVFSILIWFVYRKQLSTMLAALGETRRSNEATEKSNEIAERSLVLGRRSWLVVNIDYHGFPPMPTSSGASVSSNVSVTNVGAVPASVQRYGCGFILDSLPERLPLIADQCEASGPIIEGGTSLTLDRRWLVGDLASDPERNLYFWWVVEYSDCFERPWRTTRCWRRIRGRHDWESMPGYNLLD